MNILAIDTSSAPACVAIVADGRLLGEFNINSGRSHSENLHYLVEALLTACGIESKQLDAIAAVCGPGSFTGLRIGVSAAKGLAYVLGIPCVAVNTLESLAMNCSGRKELIVPMMDARRNQVYGGSYTVNTGFPVNVIECRPYDLDELLLLVKEKSALMNVSPLFLGDGTVRFREHIMEVIPNAAIAEEGIMLQHGASAAILGYRDFVAGKSVPAEQFVPEYYRDSSAKTTAERRAEKAAK